MAKNKKTKIIATIGPVSENENSIRELIKSGVNVFRLNFSHATHQEHGNRVKLIRKVEKELGANVSILADLCGPKIRVDNLENPIIVKAGETYGFIEVGNEQTCKSDLIPVSYPNLVEEIKIGDRIFVADGTIGFIVEEHKGDVLIAKALNDGKITSKKGVNFPDSQLSVSAATSKDIADLEFIVTQDIDIVALSFVMRASDIEPLNKVFEKAGKKLPVVAKIEKPEAVEKIDEILDVFDGVMVARGDLGIEVPIEKVPQIQREIILKARQRAKAVVVATQMLESMIDNPVPTRAEVSDVATAIYGGADAIMLSGETAVGKYHVDAVKMMVKICNETEPLYVSNPVSSRQTVTEAIADAIFTITKSIDISAITTTTLSGYTAREISSKRPQLKTYAFSPNLSTVKWLNLYWGVEAFQVDEFIEDVEELFYKIKENLLQNSKVTKGDKVIFSAGVPFGKVGDTNMLQIETI